MRYKMPDLNATFHRNPPARHQPGLRRGEGKHGHAGKARAAQSTGSRGAPPVNNSWGRGSDKTEDLSSASPLSSRVTAAQPARAAPPGRGLEHGTVHPPRAMPPCVQLKAAEPGELRWSQGLSECPELTKEQPRIVCAEHLATGSPVLNVKHVELTLKQN